MVIHAARFEWPSVAPLTFMPSLGHLPAGAVKDIVVTYLSEKPLQLKAVVTTLKAAQLKVAAGPAASDWDNRIAAGSAAALPEPKLEVASAKEAAPVSVPLTVQPQLVQDVTLFLFCCVLLLQVKAFKGLVASSCFNTHHVSITSCNVQGC